MSKLYFVGALSSDCTLGLSVHSPDVLAVDGIDGVADGSDGDVVVAADTVADGGDVGGGDFVGGVVQESLNAVSAGHGLFGVVAVAVVVVVAAVLAVVAVAAL